MITMLSIFLLEVAMSFPVPAALQGAPVAAMLSLLMAILLYACVDDLFRRGGFLNRFLYLLSAAWFFSRWPVWADSVEAVYLATGPGGPALAMTSAFLMVVPLGILLCPILALARERYG